MCRFEHDLHNQGVVSTSLHVDPLVVTSHAQVEAHKAAGEGSGWEARGDWEAAWGGCWRGNSQGMGKDTCRRENRAEGEDSGEGRGGLDTHGGAGDDDEAGSTSQSEGEERGGEGGGSAGRSAGICAGADRGRGSGWGASTAGGAIPTAVE